MALTQRDASRFTWTWTGGRSLVHGSSWGRSYVNREEGLGSHYLSFFPRPIIPYGFCGRKAPWKQKAWVVCSHKSWPVLRHRHLWLDLFYRGPVHVFHTPDLAFRQPLCLFGVGRAITVSRKLVLGVGAVFRRPPPPPPPRCPSRPGMELKFGLFSAPAPTPPPVRTPTFRWNAGRLVLLQQREVKPLGWRWQQGTPCSFYLADERKGRPSVDSLV